MWAITSEMLFLGVAVVAFSGGCRSARPRAADTDWAPGMASKTTYDMNQQRTAGETPPAASQWTCPMHPNVKQAGPGKCPICGMDLVRSDASSAGGQGSSSSHSHSSGDGHSHGSGGGCSHCG